MSGGCPGMGEHWDLQSLHAAIVIWAIEIDMNTNTQTESRTDSFLSVRYD